MFVSDGFDQLTALLQLQQPTSYASEFPGGLSVPLDVQPSQPYTTREASFVCSFPCTLVQAAEAAAAATTAAAAADGESVMQQQIPTAACALNITVNLTLYLPTGSAANGATQLVCVFSPGDSRMHAFNSIFCAYAPCPCVSLLWAYALRGLTLDVHVGHACGRCTANVIPLCMHHAHWAHACHLTCVMHSHNPAGPASASFLSSTYCSYCTAKASLLIPNCSPHVS